MPLPFQKGAKASPKIQPENLHYIRVMKEEQLLVLQQKALYVLANFLDYISGSENFWVTVGSKFDRTAYMFSLKNDVEDEEGNKPEPIKIYSANIVSLIEKTYSIILDWEEEAKNKQEYLDNGGEPF